MTLSNAVEIVFLAATVPVLLRVNHERDGRTEGGTDGGTDSDDSNRGESNLRELLHLSFLSRYLKNVNG